MTELSELIREINEKPEVITKIPWADETNGFEDSRIRNILMGVYPLELAKMVADCILDAFDLCSKMCDVRAMGKNPYDKNDPMLYEKTYDMFIDGEWVPYNMEQYIKYLIIKLENRKGAEKIDSIVLQCCNATPNFSEGLEENTEEDVAATCNAGEVADNKIANALLKMMSDKILRKKSDFAWVMVAMHRELDKHYTHETFPDFLERIGIPKSKGKSIGCPSNETLRRFKSDYEMNFSIPVDEWKYPIHDIDHAREVYKRFMEYLRKA